MGDRGLHTSIWATKGGKKTVGRLGDWICPSCGFSNFERRTECFRCSHTPAIASFKDDAIERQYRRQHLHLPQNGDCHSGNGGHESIQDGIQGHITMGPVENYVMRSPKVSNVRNGLYTSCWAPRNSSRQSYVSGSVELWTKVVPKVNATSNSSMQNISSTMPSSLDLGLPYEVQHYILAMMQRILEETCFDFASRWIPNLLKENNWTCSEAVELSTWRKVLPLALPPDAILPSKNYSLEQALANAVRIRNSAVHRHLRDNAEIRQFALQSQDLTSMFSDVTRQSKFDHLRDALDDWDITSQQDPQAARNKLQEALLAISERPVDDMDWTPNAASLQEVPFDAGALLEVEDADEMELD